MSLPTVVASARDSVVRHELESHVIGGDAKDDAVLGDAVAEALERLPPEAVEGSLCAVEVARVHDDVESGHGREP